MRNRSSPGRLLAVVTTVLAILAGMVAFRPVAAQAGVTVIYNVLYRTTADGYPLYLDVIKPTGQGGPYPAVLIVHEGWNGGKRDSATQYAKSLARAGFVAFSIDYRLVCLTPPPDGSCGPFPYQVEDMEAAMDWINANGAQYGWNGQHIGAIGGSGGATLVQTLGTIAPAAEKPQAVVAWSGQPELWRYDYSKDPAGLAKELYPYMGCPYEGQAACPDKWYAASAISYVDSTGPPQYMATGHEERKVPYQEIVDFAGALREAGVEAFDREPDTFYHAINLSTVVVYGCCTTIRDESVSFLHTFLDSSPQADVAVTETAPTTAAAGGQATFDMAVSNNGPLWSSQTVLTDPLPAGVHLISASASQGTCTGTTTVTCDLGLLPPGEDPATVSISVTGDQPGLVTNAVTAGSSEGDPNGSNNSASAQVNFVSNGSQFNGFLRRADGTGIAGQDVILTPPGGGRIQTTSAADGHFSFAVAPGSYGLEVSGGATDPGLLPTSYDVSVPSFDLTSSVTQDLTVPIATTHLTVLGPGGNPVPGVSVNFPCTAVTPFELAPGKTASGTECSGGSPDAAGSRPLALLPVGSATITATPPDTIGLVPTSLTVAIQGQDLALQVLPLPAVYVSDASVVEGGPGTSTAANFQLTLSNPSLSPVTVKVNTGGGTAIADIDYQSLPTTNLSFPPGETAKTVQVPVYGDAAHEGNETFNLQVSASPSQGVTADSSGTATIIDDEGPLSVAVSDASVVEGNSGTTTASFGVSLSDPLVAGQTVTANVSTQNVSATAGTDYVALPSTQLTWTSADPLQKQVQVTVYGDTAGESNETFLLKITGSSANVAVADSQGTGTIVNDDPSVSTLPLPSVAISDTSLVEGGPGTTSMAAFTVTLSAASSSPVSVTATSADGSATAGTDYQALAPTVVTFAPGQTLQQVQVPVTGDAAHEGNETFALSLSAPSRVTIADRTATATIIDDEEPLRLYTSDGWAMEGATSTTALTFSVALSAPLAPDQTVTVTFETGNGKATPGVDYAAVPASLLTWTSSDPVVKTVTVWVYGDTSPEANETFLLKLSAPSSNVTIADTSGTGIIITDD